MTLKWKLSNKTETINKRKWSDLIGLSNGCKRAWLWLVKRTLRRKNFMPENILEIALTSYCNTISQLIEKCLLQIRGFRWRENEESMFWSFHPLADKTSNEHLTQMRDEKWRLRFYFLFSIRQVWRFIFVVVFLNFLSVNCASFFHKGNFCEKIESISRLKLVHCNTAVEQRLGICWLV